MNEDVNAKTFVVGLGASAGGINAFREFFSKVSSDSGMAFVVILHLSPDYESKLAELLQLTINIPVTQVRETVRIEPDHIYVISPNQSLTLEDGHLSVTVTRGHDERRAPIDIFFRTLAESQQSRAVSVVLSGTGSDGSMGLKRVKESGGLTIVQDPSEAEFADMPRNAIATGLVDFVLPVSEIPDRIVAYRQQLGRIRIQYDESVGITPDQSLIDLFTIIRLRTGHDFSNYKRGTILRRIERRMGLSEITELSHYVRFIREHPEETGKLLKDLLISVTNFFRDRDAFDVLESQIIPKLFEGKSNIGQVRIWVPACATGEEAYSIAMLLSEYCMKLAFPPAVLVFATDIDEGAIATAREGFFTDAEVADVSQERLRSFFIKEALGYRVRRELREMVLFAAHNVVKDPPFSHLDLISCRNLLIYLNRSAQEKLLQIFQFALHTGGFLFLGGAESVEAAPDLFVSEIKEHHIYRSRSIATRYSIPVTDVTSLAPMVKRTSEHHQALERATERLTFMELHQKLLEHYAPPSIVVNNNFDIIHISESAGRYLTIPGGEPSHNLLKLLRPELRVEVRTALYQASQSLTSIEARGLKVEFDGKQEEINLKVRPARSDVDSTHGLFLVLFEPVSSLIQDRSEEVVPIDPSALKLEDELLKVKAQLTATIEQYEIQQEELRSSNEELQAMNEELRSSAEELETSKEELQSVNEELTTVNHELKVKIEELSKSNNDFQNLMASTEIGTIFLDRALRVKLFTPNAREIFNLISGDVGRPLLDITNKLHVPNILEDLEKVLKSLQTIEREIQTLSGDWFLMRVLPYRTTEDRIDGVVLTFLNITEHKRSQARERASEEYMKLVIESVKDYAIFTVSTDRRIATWNSGAERVFGYRESEIIGQSSDILFMPEDRNRGVPEMEMTTAEKEGRASDERFHLRKDGTRIYCSGVMAPLRGGELKGFVKIAQDLSEQKRAHEELRRTRDELEHRVRERTFELERANELLRVQVKERAAAEERARALLRQVVTVQEEERLRIARDLHDQLGQQLTALRLNLELLSEDCRGNEKLKSRIALLKAAAETIDSEVDFLAWELRPSALDELGLIAAIERFIVEWSKHFGVTAQFHSNGMDGVRLAPKAEINLYRIIQEALNNIHKHAAAVRVDILLERRGKRAVLIIEDDGRGIEPEKLTADGAQGLGLIGMRERAGLIGGSLEIESTPGKGTTIFVRVPIEDNSKESNE
jgi:two-component system, chemotaxis family, CheB/CheR fusion protein